MGVTQTAGTPLRILIIDDQDSSRWDLIKALEPGGHQVIPRADAQQALVDSARQTFDFIFLDIHCDAQRGLEQIRPILQLNPRAKLIVLIEEGSINAAVEAIKRGAADYIAKPFNAAQVQLVLRGVAQRRNLELKLAAIQTVLDEDPEADFPTSSPFMRRTLELAKQVAISQAPVLICGEIGTGKGRLARALHTWSPRADLAHALVSCETKDADALEEELFGLAAETGADAPPEKIGQVALCDGGTLILDEIGSLPPSLQPKIEDLLSDGQYERRDDFVVRTSNLRLVATTSADLERRVAQRRFRQELLFAFDVVRLEIPPLRNRPEDIAMLAQRYLTYFARQNNRRIGGFSADAMSALKHHSWPGNQRELRNLIERAVILCLSEEIELKHFPSNLLNSSSAYQPGDLVPLETIEDLHIRGVLAAAGSVKGAATILGVNYSTLWRRLRKTRLESDRPVPLRIPPAAGLTPEAG